MRIRGAVLEEIGRSAPYAASRPITISELELDGPGPGEILVKIDAAGLCHSDLSVVNGVRPRPVPMLLGHESAGTVATLGAGVDDLDVGQRVVMTFLPRCGQCAGCETSGKLPCELGAASNGAGTLLGGGLRLRRGGQIVRHHLGESAFATHAVVNRHSVVPVPRDVPPEVAALLGCAVLTGGGAVLNVGHPQAGQDLVIVGLGGVGMAAVYTTARALEIGLKAPVVIEAAGHRRAFEAAVQLTAPGGTTVTVGLPHPDARAEISPLVLTAEARTIVGSYLGSAVPSRDIPTYVEMYREGRLPVQGLISSMIGLDEINEAMDALAQGEALRQIIVFN